MTTTFSISGGLNIVLAALGYVWLQKPYARKLYVLTAHASIFGLIVQTCLLQPWQNGLRG